MKKFANDFLKKHSAKAANNYYYYCAAAANTAAFANATASGAATDTLLK